ncbi:hypothetical protein P7K49_019054 [Saguinus oedipus]|uniref:Basic proline-rich protein-like n=1 Tax=Saguinus oedipus TaxID=9490 RepID=A0ABQ9UW85_SAGOE|nr:hypothetical protein P7K49_019054 [Saguinus oedipus]
MDSREHPAHESRARAWTLRTSTAGATSRARQEGPSLCQRLGGAGEEALARSLSEGRSEDAPAPHGQRAGPSSGILRSAPRLPPPAALPEYARGDARHLREKRVGNREPPLPTPTPFASPRRYLLRFRGFPPTWADATSSRYRVQSPTDTTASASSSRKRLRSSFTGRRRRRSRAARGLPMAPRPGGRRRRGLQPPEPPPPGQAPLPGRPASRSSVSGLHRGRLPRLLSGRARAHAPGARGPRAARVPSRSLREWSPAPPPRVCSAPGSPRLAAPVAGSPPPSLAARHPPSLAAQKEASPAHGRPPPPAPDWAPGSGRSRSPHLARPRPRPSTGGLRPGEAGDKKRLFWLP